MVSAKTPGPPTGLPDGYSAIPIHAPGQSPLRLCVVARQTPDPAAGSMVLLQDHCDAQACLGCVTDAAGRVREWVELRVQNVDGLKASLPAVRQTLSNRSLDERWARQVETTRALNPQGFLETGWETNPPRPTFLDVPRRVAIQPGEGAEGAPWELCRDDARLEAVGLPPYSTSLVRYLHQPSAGKDSKFVPVVSGAPEGAATRPLAEILGPSANAVPFNPQGGLMLAQTFCPIPFEDYVDLLGGKPWPGFEHGKKLFTFDEAYRDLNDWNQILCGGAHLFLGAQGRAGRFVETFHLKLQLLADVFRQVRAFVQHQQLPFLNLAADTFRVKFEPVGARLPRFWTARCALVKPSDALALPVEAGEFRYFIRARAGGTSIYLPEGLDRSHEGSASVRLRKVLPAEQGRTVLEGTLITQERLPASPRDLLWIRLPLPSGRVDLYGHLYAAEGLAPGEARFRTLPQAWPATTLKALSAAEGAAFAQVPFEIVPLFSSPADLHALGVLVVRTLLVNAQTTLPIALDETLSLARQAAAEGPADAPLGQRIAALLAKESRYLASLGPHRLVHEPVEPAQALQLLPVELWSDALATLVRLFPGLSPESLCRDCGDAPALALETVFDQPLQELERLLERSRSLIVIDWNYNREVRSVIQSVLDRQTGG